MTLRKVVLRPALLAAGLLLIPLVAMQFTAEVVWTALDFITVGLLVFGTGLAYELVAQRGSGWQYRLAVGAALAVGLLLVWVNLAVGLLGSEHNPANLLYAGVLAVALGGSLAARWQPRGLGHALFAAALTQALVPVLALLIWPARIAAAGTPDGLRELGANSFFVLLWLGAAGLCWRARAAGRHQPQSAGAGRQGL